MNRKIIFVDTDKKSEWNRISSELASKLEFLKRNHTSDKENVKEYIKKNCSPEILYGLMKQLLELEKIWQIGEIKIE